MCDGYSRIVDTTLFEPIMVAPRLKTSGRHIGDVTNQPRKKENASVKYTVIYIYIYIYIMTACTVSTHADISIVTIPSSYDEYSSTCPSWGK